MTDNLELWHSVEKTPIEHTKPITGKSYQGTSPKPHYIIQKATETFGPAGIGWGFTVDERIEDGAMIEPGFFEKLHVAKVKVWFIWKDKRGEVEHIGGTVFSGRRSNGKGFTDEDAPKKSVTDALVKALSMIGFAGDIFMGRYDDSKYTNELKEEREEAKREASKPKPARETVVPIRPPASSPLVAMGNEAASRGKEVFLTYWRGLTKEQRKTIGTKAQMAAWEAMALDADARQHETPFDDVPPFDDEARYVSV